jgi:hypothetical protein
MTDTKALLADLDAFREKCEEAEYTDTGDAWNMIDRLESALVEVIAWPVAENDAPAYAVEVHIKVVDKRGATDTFDGTYVSTAVAHAEVSQFFTDLLLRPIPPGGSDA